MGKMRTFTALLTVLGIFYLTFAEDVETKFESGRFQNRYPNRNPFFNNRYLKNSPDFYGNPRYYENRLKSYNPSVLEAQARLVEQDIKTPQNGVYSYAYKTENGIQAEEYGVVEEIIRNEPKHFVEGSYSFVTPEGSHILVRYTADERGYRPVVTYGITDPAQFARRVVVGNKSN